MIASPQRASVDMASTFATPDGRTYNTDADFGGGVTYNATVAPGTPTDVNVVVSGNGFVGAPAVGGGTLQQSPGDVMMHELMVHAEPIMRTGVMGSIQLENAARREMPGMIERAVDPSHPN